MARSTTEFNDATVLVKLTPEDHVMIGARPLESHMGERDAAEKIEEGAPTVTLLEYGDYQCPHCAMAAPIVKNLQQHFGNSLRYAWRHFPLEEIHPLADAAAATAEWAAANARFWEMHDLLLRNQQDLSMDLLLALADEVGLDDQDLAEALQQDAFAESVAADVESGEEAGVHGTPTFFVNGVKHESGWEFDSLREAIEEAMRGRGQRAA